MKRFALLPAISVFVLIGCGGGGGDSSDPAPVPPTVDITGTWDALITRTGGTQGSIGFQYPAVITVVQSGSSVSGTWITPGGGGQASGSVSGDDHDLTIAQTSPCIGTYQGIGMVNGSQMSGTYTGSDCFGTLQASFTAIKR